MWNRRFITCILFLCILSKVDVLNNGLAQTPPMGWMSWGYYMCGVKCDEKPEKCLDENLIMSVADVFYEDGYQEAGFEYIIIDDCWSEKQRDLNHRLVPDKKRFPRGMKFLADYIHAHGLKFGMYTNIAHVTCMGYPGSRNFFEIDAQTFAEWGIDYLKVDGCFVEKNYLDTAYIELGQKLNETKRHMVYSCSWPYYVQFIHNTTPDYKNIVPHCNLWRNYHDVVTKWNAVRSIILYYQEHYDEFAPYHGPGHWHDPDMLVLGTGALTDSQSRVHLSVYAMLSAPLLLSCDMRKITPHEKRLLQNMDLIAIAQDPMGIMAKPYKLRGGITLWVKPHLPKKGDRYHSVSFALVNLYSRDVAVSFVPGQYGLNSTDGYTVMDVFLNDYFRNITLKDHIYVTVPGEDVILYTLFPL